MTVEVNIYDSIMSYSIYFVRSIQLELRPYSASSLKDNQLCKHEISFNGAQLKKKI